MLQTDEAIRREQELKNARQELENLLTDYRTPLFEAYIDRDWETN